MVLGVLESSSHQHVDHRTTADDDLCAPEIQAEFVENWSNASVPAIPSTVLPNGIEMPMLGLGKKNVNVIRIRAIVLVNNRTNNNLTKQSSEKAFRDRSFFLSVADGADEADGAYVLFSPTSSCFLQRSI
jgi:hypothetical protein